MSRLIDLEPHEPAPSADTANAATDDDATADSSVDLRLDVIDIGEAVEVRRRFDNAWARGFVVAELGADGYRLRRNSDGALLPVGFPRADLRRSGV